MFFEDEDKDQSKNMDDYDLDFEDDKSISWDKLLDEAESEQLPKKANEDDLLIEDEESFDSLLQTQELNIDEEDKTYEDTLMQEDSAGDFEQELTIVGDDYEVEPQRAANLDVALEPTVEPEIEYQDSNSINMLDDMGEPPVQEIVYNEPVITQEPVRQSVPEPSFEPVRPNIPEPSFEPAQERFTQEEEPPMRERTPIAAPKQKSSAGFWGAIAAFALVVAAGLIWFLVQNKPGDIAASGDFSALSGNNGDQQQTSGQNDFDSRVDTPQDAQQPAPAAPQDPQPAAQTGSQPTAAGQDAPIAPKVVGKPATPASAKAKIADDKKVTVKIVNTGRINPFTPAAGININKFGFMTAPRVDILEPPTQLGNLSDELDRLMKITVSGILYDGAKPSAIINVDNVDYFVQKNDRVDDFTVAAISKDMVVIKKGNNLYRATIGQSFSGGSIPGQVQRSPQRQYVSVSDININPQQL